MQCVRVSLCRENAQCGMSYVLLFPHVHAGVCPPPPQTQSCAVLLRILRICLSVNLALCSMSLIDTGAGVSHHRLYIYTSSTMLPAYASKFLGTGMRGMRSGWRWRTVRFVVCCQCGCVARCVSVSVSVSSVCLSCVCL